MTSPIDPDPGAWCAAVVEAGLATAAAASVEVGGEAISGSAGDASTAASLFDLASLTKPLSATLALALHESGVLDLATPLGAVWPRCEAGLAAKTLEDLLRHRAGFDRWMPLYAMCRDPYEVATRLLAGEWLQPSAEPIYSDLGYILWTLTVERVVETPYWVLLHDVVLERLGAEEFAPAFGGDRTAVPCRLTTGREVELAAQRGQRIEALAAPGPGEAQDGNCRFFGRPLGHAGVFGSAPALLRLAREWLHPGSLLTRPMVDRALSGPGRFAMGWYRRDETAVGRELGPQAFGHDGFTGGTVWIDPDAELICVALCHRASLASSLLSPRLELVRQSRGRHRAADPRGGRKEIR